MPKTRIVVIEDDQDLAQAFTDFVASEGYAAQAPGSFAEAVAVLQGGEYDLVITDHQLANWRGDGRGHFDEELHPHIRPGVPVLFMSADATSVLAKHNLDGHRCDHIPKPFVLDLLLQKIRGLLFPVAA